MTQMLQILGIACLTAAAPVTTSAIQDATEAAETSPLQSVAASAASGAAGLRVVVDPETGKIVADPTARQLDRLSEGIAIEKRRSSEQLREFALPGGGKGVFLDGWADHALKVEVGPDGKIQAACSHAGRHGADGSPEGNQ